MLSNDVTKARIQYFLLKKLNVPLKIRRKMSVLAIFGLGNFPGPKLGTKLERISKYPQQTCSIMMFGL